MLISGQVDISLHNKNDQYPLQLKPHKATHSEVFRSILGLHQSLLLSFPSNCQLSLPLYGRLPTRPAHPSPVCEVWPDLNTPQLPRMQTLSSTTLPQENNAVCECAQMHVFCLHGVLACACVYVHVHIQSPWTQHSSGYFSCCIFEIMTNIKGNGIHWILWAADILMGQGRAKIREKNNYLKNLLEGKEGSP